MTSVRWSIAVLLAILSDAVASRGQSVGAIPEEELGQRVAVSTSQIVWKVDSDLPKEAMVYRTKSRQVADAALSALVSKYGWKQRAIPTSFGQGEPNAMTFGNETGDKYVTFHPDYGGFELYLADKSGFRYDKTTKKPIVEALLSNEEALRRSIDLLPMAGLSTNDLVVSKETGLPYYVASCNQVGFTDRETKERKKLCTNTRIKFMQQVGGHKVYGFGGGGCAEFIFVSHGELACVTWLMREAVAFKRMELKDRNAILAAIRNGECYSWTKREFAGEKLTVTEVEVEYYEGNERRLQEYFVPLYAIACRLMEAGAEREIHLLLPALK
jgi:hypothetical protein